MLSKFSNLFKKEGEDGQELPDAQEASQSTPPASPPPPPPLSATPPAETPPPVAPASGILQPPQKPAATGSGKQKRITQRITIPVPPPPPPPLPPGLSSESTLEIPVSLIASALPEDALATPKGELLSSTENASMPSASLLGMLPTGKIEYSLKELANYLPAGTLKEDVSEEKISLPLAEIVKVIPPELLSRRPDQKPLDEKVRQLADPFSIESLAASQEETEPAPESAETETADTSVPPPPAPVMEEEEETSSPAPAPAPAPALEIPVEEPAPETPALSEPILETTEISGEPSPEPVPAPDLSFAKEPSLQEMLESGMPEVTTPPSAEETPPPPPPPDSLTPESPPTPEEPLQDLSEMLAGGSGEAQPEPASPVQDAEEKVEVQTETKSEAFFFGSTEEPPKETSAEAPSAVEEPEPVQPESQPEFTVPDVSSADEPSSEEPVEPAPDEETPEPTPEPVEAVEPTPAPAVDFSSFQSPQESESTPEPAPEAEPSAPAPASAFSSPSLCLDLNHCEAAELISAGCPEPIVRKILAWRELHGAFEDPQTLWKIPGMTEEIYNILAVSLEEETADGLEELFGLPAGTSLTVKDVASRIRHLPFMMGCIIGGMEGLPIAFDYEDKKFAKSICAFAPRLLQQAQSTMEEISENEVDEIHLIQEEKTISIFRCAHLLIITLNRKKGLSIRDAELIRHVTVKLANVRKDA